MQRLALQRAVVDELIQAALYTPKVAATAAPIQAALVALRTELRAIAGTPTVAAGTSAVPLDRYAAALRRRWRRTEAVSARLHALVGPRSAAGARRGAAALTRSIALCDAIRTALGRRDIAAADTAIHSLFSVVGDLG